MRILISFVFTLFSVVTIAGCASSMDAREEISAETSSEIDFHLLMAELALQRHQFRRASGEYRQAAELSMTAEVAARATQVANQFGFLEDELVSAGRWVELAPEDAQARGYLAAALVDSGRPREAVPHLQVLKNSAESESSGFIQVLALLLNRDDVGAATEAMRRLAAETPSIVEGQYALATLALRSGETEAALEGASRAIELRPDWAPARLVYARALIAAGEIEAGLAQAAAAANEDGEVATRLEYAILLASAGRLAEARTELEEILEERPGLPDALRALAFVEYQSGQLDVARRYFSELLMTGRFTDDAFFYLGAIAELEQDFRLAIRLYTRVGPGSNMLPAQVRASRLLYELGEEQASLDTLERLGEYYPDYAVEALLARTTLLVEMGRPEEALELFREGIVEYPDEDSLLYGRAFLYERLDRIDEAVAELQQIVRQRPNDATALNALGYTLADRTEHYREAERYIRQALKLEPDNPAIIDSMGWVLYRRGRYDPALKHLRRAYDLSGDPEIAAHLGEVLWTLGRTDQARDVIDAALMEYPDSPQLLEVFQRFGE